MMSKGAGRRRPPEEGLAGRRQDGGRDHQPDGLERRDGGARPIREADGDLAQKIMDNMFTFDDLDKIDDKGIQALLKEVQSESLVSP